jgi:hypothetical protein
MVVGDMIEVKTIPFTWLVKEVETNKIYLLGFDGYVAVSSTL